MGTWTGLVVDAIKRGCAQVAPDDGDIVGISGPYEYTDDTDTITVETTDGHRCRITIMCIGEIADDTAQED